MTSRQERLARPAFNVITRATHEPSMDRTNCITCRMTTSSVCEDDIACEVHTFEDDKNYLEMLNGMEIKQTLQEGLGELVNCSVESVKYCGYTAIQQYVETRGI